MGLSIKNAEVEAMARQLARRRNISMTEAIRQSLEREIAREKLVIRAEGSDLYRAVMDISDRVASYPDVNDLTEGEILGYDESGAPTR